MNLLFWRKRKSPEAPWYARGYIPFPPTPQIAVILTSGTIVRIDNINQRITIEENHGTFLNHKLFEVNLQPSQWGE